MFADLYIKRIEKWEKQVVNHLIDSFEESGWENVLPEELILQDSGKYISVIKASTIFNLAQNILKKKQINYPSFTSYTLYKKAKKYIVIKSTKDDKLIKIHTTNGVDLIFVKDNPDVQGLIKSIKEKNPMSDDPIVLKSNKLIKSKPKEKEDPLRTWCQSFLNEYSNNNSVERSIENVPDYKPSNSQIQKLQNKRDKDLLNWGNNL